MLFCVQGVFRTLSRQCVSSGFVTISVKSVYVLIACQMSNCFLSTFVADFVSHCAASDVIKNCLCFVFYLSHTLMITVWLLVLQIMLWQRVSLQFCRNSCQRSYFSDLVPISVEHCWLLTIPVPNYVNATCCYRLFFIRWCRKLCPAGFLKLS